MSNSLEERLKTHSSAFDGLLSLIPAKYYYDDATQDQWQQKKKSKQELKSNKRAKLNPESKQNADEYLNSHASAKDVMDNKAKNAHLVKLPKKLPKPITEESDDDDDEDVEIPDMDVSGDEEVEEEVEDVKKNGDDDDELMNDEAGLIFDDDGNEVEVAGTFKKQEIIDKKNKKKELSEDEKLKKQENLKKLREKLESKINNLREKRRAIGTKAAGAPKSRDQILAERQRKEELKKQQKRKHDELEDDEDSDDDSDSDMESDVEETTNKDVLFGNIVFNDGSQVTSDLSKIRNSADKKKQKGPANNDIKAHLNKLEKKKQKLASMSAEDQEKQKEKDKWQRVMAQAEGIKVKDDEKLLKKALKRKEKKKLRSEIEWRERKQVVKDTVAARAKRREENLKARRDNKGKKHKPRLKKFTGTVNKAQIKKKRAGFEGSAKAKPKKK
ncbi:Ribosomal RNA-processing protein 14 [Candida viswanathii]|uniref:Ribosomal RNA-processing protein 14 n=1 Tax=Candida viswanathii TaxID=5486 RepID=A0A367YLG9_9ASCO|nr:Ribosomal RNA-processing protein 14 [Candida viswanathii]